MGRYVIERTLPGAGSLSQQQLKEISAKSNEVIDGLGNGIAWIESYVTDDKLYCVYESPNQELIEEHATQGEFPCDSVSEIRTTISPATGR